MHVCADRNETQNWLKLNTTQRADAMATLAQQAMRNATDPPVMRDAAAATAMTQLWRYYHHPNDLAADCRRADLTAYLMLVGLGFAARVAVYLLVRWKVSRKAQS
jgi:hypothetical protein